MFSVGLKFKYKLISRALCLTRYHSGSWTKAPGWSQQAESRGTESTRSLSAGSTLWQALVAWLCLQILLQILSGCSVTSVMPGPCWASQSVSECAEGHLYRTEAQPRDASPGSPSGSLALPACTPWESATTFCQVHRTQPVFTTTKKARTGLAWHRQDWNSCLGS